MKNSISSDVNTIESSQIPAAMLVEPISAEELNARAKQGKRWLHKDLRHAVSVAASPEASVTAAEDCLRSSLAYIVTVGVLRRNPALRFEVIYNAACKHFDAYYLYELIGMAYVVQGRLKAQSGAQSGGAQ